MRLTRRSFLGAGLTVAAGFGMTPRSARGGVDSHNLIVVFARGGWDPVWSIDPKDSPNIDSPAGGVVKTFANDIDIVTHAAHPDIAGFFEAHADKCAVIRGISVGSIAHFPCHVRMMTGARSELKPDIGAINGAVHGLDLALPYADVGGGGYAGPFASMMGRVGQRNQIVSLLDRQQALDPAPSLDYDATPLYAPDAGAKALIDAFRSDRAAVAKEARGQFGVNAGRFDDFAGSFINGDKLRTIDAIVGLKMASGSGLTPQITAAVAMLQGTSCSAYLDPHLDFDTHDTIADQGVHQNTLFAGISELIAALEAASLLGTTTIVVMSEMGRTPKLNGNTNNAGKDHWPYTSALVLGAGVKPGVYGGTDDQLYGRGIDLATGKPQDGALPLAYDNFAAGILTLIGIDSKEWYPNVTPIQGFIV